MNKNQIYDFIVELGGDCFQGEQRPPCEICPFQDKCLKKIIHLAQSIPKETRLRWALDEIMQEVLLNDEENTEL